MKKIEYHKIASYEAKKEDVSKVVLLYSGGLDTSCILKWIQDNYEADVIALTLDLGQQVDDLEEIKQKALKLGAIKAYVLDVKDEFADEYLAKSIKANGSYQGDYHISTISRYLMAKKAIEIAHDELMNNFRGNISTFIGNDKLVPQEDFWIYNPASPIDIQNQVINTATSIVKFRLG